MYSEFGLKGFCIRKGALVCVMNEQFNSEAFDYILVRI